MQPSARGWAAGWAEDGQLVALDIGGRDVNGHCRDLWPNTRWTVLDILDGPGVDVVADAADWAPDQLYDLVLCTEVLEHTPRWAQVVATAAEALRPGGRLVVTCAGPGWPEHSALADGPLQPGEYYANVSAHELDEAMRAAGLGAILTVQAGRDTHGVGAR